MTPTENPQIYSMASFFYAQLSPTERPDVDQDASKRHSRKKYGDGLITQVSVDVCSQSIF